MMGVVIALGVVVAILIVLFGSSGGSHRVSHHRPPPPPKKTDPHITKEEPVKSPPRTGVGVVTKTTSNYDYSKRDRSKPSDASQAYHFPDGRVITVSNEPGSSTPTISEYNSSSDSSSTSCDTSDSSSSSGSCDSGSSSWD
jgi:hypothetical protein